MKCVCVVTNKKNMEMVDKIVQVAQKRFGDVLVLTEKTRKRCRGAGSGTLLIVKTEDITKTNFLGWDVLILNGGKWKSNFIHNPNGFIIADCENEGDVQTAKKMNGKTVVCGMRNYCTVNVSSDNEEDMNISMQRCMENTEGMLVEQQEVKIHKVSGLSKYEHMAICVCELLLGITEKQF